MKEETIRKKLNKAGLKATPARLAILALFAKRHTPLSADDIAIALKKEKIDLVTIYRTFASLEKAFILKRVDLRRDAAYFEMADNHHHHHLVCTECGDIEDFELCDIGNLSQKILKKSSKFKAVSDHAFELFGLCTSCAGK